MDKERLTLAPIAVVHSPFKEKFGIPRQAGLAPHARARVRMLPPYDSREAVDGIDGFSHLWLIFGFHACVDQGWKPRVRPPRLGGNQELGVFATRSPFRPNPLGLSAVRLERVERSAGITLHVSGGDLLDGTPVYDIKPYVSYADAIENATDGFARGAPNPAYPVEFDAAALNQLIEQPHADDLRQLIEETLRLDPRPAYRNGPEPERVYGVRVAGVDVRWRVLDDAIRVEQLVPMRVAD